MPGGRPRNEFSPEELAQVKKLASIGLTTEQIGDYLGLTDNGVRQAAFKHPEFDNAIKTGRSMGIGGVSNTLYQKAMAGSETSMIFYLKCQGKWRERRATPIEEALETLLDAGVLPDDIAEAGLEELQGMQSKLKDTLSKVVSKRKKSKQGE